MFLINNLYCSFWSWTKGSILCFLILLMVRNGLSQNENQTLKLSSKEDSSSEDVSNLLGESLSQKDSSGPEYKDVPSDNVHDSEVNVFIERILSFRKILRGFLPKGFPVKANDESHSTLTSEPSVKAESLGDLHKDGESLSITDTEMGSSSAISLNSSMRENFNMTENNSTKTANSSQTKKVSCLPLEDYKDRVDDVEIVNGTMLQRLLQSNPNITSRSTSAKCLLVYFFSPYCPFSTQGSAYVNALARSLPSIPIYGLDSIEHHSLNARYGIMGTPSLVLFHNGNVASRYNSTEFATYYLEVFVHHYTDQKISSINVTSHDFKAHLPSQTIITPNYALYFAWAFLLVCGGCLFLNSEFYSKLTETILNNWREAEAQHEHND